MCLVGVFHNRDNSYILFKNRDLEYRPNIPEPEIVKNGDNTNILIIFPSSEKTSNEIWGGINKFGLSLQFADLYTNKLSFSDKILEEKRIPLRKLHYEIINNCKSVEEATTFILKNYMDSTLGNFDQIILIADPKNSVIMECTNEGIGLNWSEKTGYLLRSNYPINLKYLAPDPFSEPLYLSALCRYNRANELIKKNVIKDVALAKQILTDKVYGDTDLSICRSGLYSNIKQHLH